MKRWLGALLTWGGVLSGALLLWAGRAACVPARIAQGDQEQLSPLPPAEYLDLLTVGYRAAAADYLFARTLVAAGRSLLEHRNLPELSSYLGASAHLEPYFRDVYWYGDSLLTQNTVAPPLENFWAARSLLEDGLKRFPADGPLWLSAAQFMLYLAPQRLENAEQISAWKLRGAEVMQRACELLIDDPPHGCIASTKAVVAAGETDAAIRGLTRLLSLTSDTDLRAKLEARLAELVSVQRRDELVLRVNEISERNFSEATLASRGLYQVLGPRFSPSECMPRDQSSRAKCATSFRDLHPPSEIE